MLVVEVMQWEHFTISLDDADVKLIGCEAGGKGVDTPYNAAALTNGQIGIFHGMKSIFNQGEYGQIC